MWHYSAGTIVKSVGKSSWFLTYRMNYSQRVPARKHCHFDESTGTISRNDRRTLKLFNSSTSIFNLSIISAMILQRKYPASLNCSDNDHGRTATSKRSFANFNCNDNGLYILLGRRSFRFIHWLNINILDWFLVIWHFGNAVSEHTERTFSREICHSR